MTKYKILQSIFLLLLGCLLGVEVAAQGNFKGITPLVTTKAEVEKILGKPNKYNRYELEEGRVYVRYRERECKGDTNCICLVPLGTVEYISVELYYDVFIKDLNLDRRRFRESHSPHVDVYTYSDSRTGVVYEVQEGKVTHIYYYGSEETCNTLKQKSPAVNNKSMSRVRHCSLYGSFGSV